MSVDSKLFVVCDKTDIISVGNSVADALDKYSRLELDNYWQNNTDAHNRIQFLCSPKYADMNCKFSNGVSITSHDFNTFIFNFGSGDNLKRSLFMFISNTDDYNDIHHGYKIIFSIGLWGKSNDIMKVIADSISNFGAVYYDYNDCDDTGFIKL